MADSSSKTVTAGAVATTEETAEFRKKVDAEWGTYVAVVPIAFNGVPAYNVGDPVPVSNVEKHGYLDDGLVAKVGNKAANDTVTALHASASATEVSESLPAVSLGVQVPESK